MDKELTIIIPTFNMEKYLKKCLDSLIIDDEKWFNTLEVLVVNDGSRDSSSAIAHEYQKSYPEVFRVIDKENGNYGSCVNCGLTEAKGKYVKILDADDCFDTINLPSYLEFIHRNDADCILSDMVQVNFQGEVVNLYTFETPKEKVFTLEDVGNTIKNLWMHCVCYKVDNLRKIHYHQTEGISYTDQEWICLPMSICSSILYYPNVIYKYLVGREGQTINVDVWEKNFWMEIKGCKVLMNLRNVDFSPFCPNRKFIDSRIYERVLTIYFAYFSRFSTFENEELMQDIDRCLYEYDSNLYDAFNSLTTSRYVPIKIVRKWRNGKKEWVIINRIISRLVRSIKKGTNCMRPKV